MAQRTPRVIVHTDVRQLAAQLCHRRAILMESTLGSIQMRSINALSSIASAILPTIPDNPDDATLYALQATLDCWYPNYLNDLLKTEQVLDHRDTEVCLHIIATNTSQLAWTSVARALLVQSASVVRVPQSAEVIEWTLRFVDALAEVDHELAGLIEVVTWPSNDTDVSKALTQISDKVLVYGNDETVNEFRLYTENQQKILGYGNKLSFGLVLAGSDMKLASEGLALDMAIFDQRGCLSPQIIFVEGENGYASRFAQELFGSLGAIRRLLPSRDLTVGSSIREALSMDSFKSGVSQLVDPELRFAISVHENPGFSTLGVPGGVVIVPVDGLESVLGLLTKAGINGKLQGSAIGAPNYDQFAAVSQTLQDFGVHFVCKPGWLQRPPFNWREDGYSVLKSLT